MKHSPTELSQLSDEELGSLRKFRSLLNDEDNDITTDMTAFRL